MDKLEKTVSDQADLIGKQNESILYFSERSKEFYELSEVQKIIIEKKDRQINGLNIILRKYLDVYETPAGLMYEPKEKSLRQKIMDLLNHKVF